MRNRRNYYRILQVQPDAPVEIIRASYRTLMLELKRHPDLGGSNSDASVLNEAYEVLANPERRAAYFTSKAGLAAFSALSAYELFEFGIRVYYFQPDKPGDATKQILELCG